MKYLVKTFGCRVNQAESFLLEKQFQLAGIDPAICSEMPEIVVVNGCAVTQKAIKEVRQTLRNLRRTYPRALLILAGCPISYQNLSKIKLPDVDLMVANEEKLKLVEKVLNHFDLRTDQSLDWSKTHFQANFSGPRALIKIQDGCNQFCAYCLVPYLRRQFFSKKPAVVIREVNELISDRGTREVVLVGINLDRYQHNLTNLLKKVLKETKIERIRFGSINVGAFSDELIVLYRQEFNRDGARTRLARHFHLPLQSGSDRILKLMERPYTARQYLDLTTRLKKEIPGVSITTDLIVGFPGETRVDFQASLEMIKKVGFSKVHLFRFSARPGTRAASRVESEDWSLVSPKMIKERLDGIRRLAKEVGEMEAKKLAEFPSWVLPEGENRQGKLVGHTDHFLKKLVGQS